MIDNKNDLIKFLKEKYFTRTYGVQRPYRDSSALGSKIDKKFLENLYKEYSWARDHGFSELAYCVLNNIKKEPRCPVCGKKIEFKKGYSVCCGRECANKYRLDPLKYSHDIASATQEEFENFIKENVKISELDSGIKYVDLPTAKFKLFTNVDLFLVKFMKTKWPWIKSTREAIHCYVNDITEAPRCLECGKIVKFEGKKAHYGYSDFCSTECATKWASKLALDKNKIKQFIKNHYFLDNMTKTNRELCSEKKMIDSGFEPIANRVKSEVPFARDLTEAMYAYYHDIHERPVCLRCGNKVRFVDVKTGYKKYCSKKCASTRGLLKSKIKYSLDSENQITSFINNVYFKENGSPKADFEKESSMRNILNPKAYNQIKEKFPWTNSFLELAYCVKNNIKAEPRCPVCDAKLKFSRSEKRYNKYCSKECAYKYIMDPLRFILPAASEELESIEAEFKEFINKNARVLEDGRVMMLSKYYSGNFYHVPLKILSYIKARWPWTRGIREAIYCYLNNINEQPRCEECEANIAFSHIPNVYAYSKYCSRECANTASDKKYLYSKNESTINNFFQFLEKYKNEKLDDYSLDKLATILNLQKSILPRWLKKYNISLSDSRIYRSGMEISLKRFLDSLDIEYLENDRKVLKGKELDFLIPDKKLAIEMHGSYWHDVEQLAKTRFDGDISKAKNYHLDKFTSCMKQGITLFQIHENEWRDAIKREIWKSRIAVFLGAKTVTRIHARKCQIKLVEYNEASRFLETSHLDGTIPASIRLGLYYQGELVAIMTFGKNRFSKQSSDKNTEYELYRYAVKPYTRIPGGASRLLKHFIRNYTKPRDSLISFSSNDISNGNLYKKLGFKYSRTTESHFYVDQSGQVYNRIKLQKHRLPELLNIDPSELENKTAATILQEHGFHKIYSSGMTRWILDI